LDDEAMVSVPPPHFASPRSGQPKRRLLLVAPAFPPSAEVGAIRWRRFADLLAARGWALDVIAGAAREWERTDEGQLQSLPVNVRVWIPELRPALPEQAWRIIKPLVRRPRAARRPAEAPAATPVVALTQEGGPTHDQSHGAHAPTSGTLAQLAREYRARNHFASWTHWCTRVERLARAIAASHPPTAVASSGPPHMAHEAARRVAKRLNVPLLIDLRDPWFADHAEPDDMRGRTWKSRTSAYEAAACRAASRIVLNTPAAERLMRERYPALSDRMMVVMNGADPDVRHFAGTPDRFEILHAGSLYGGRDPRPLFEGVRRLLERERPAPGEVIVTFIGDTRYDGHALTDVASRAGIAAVFSSQPSVPRDEALARMGRAAVLAVLPQQWSASVPAKVFEYMQFDAWLLVMGRAGDAMTTLMETAGADVVPPGDAERIAQTLCRRWREWKSGDRPVALNADGRFDRAVQAQRLLAALESL
jgi:hypothetical protein